MNKITFLLAFLFALNILAQDKGSLSGRVLDMGLNNEPMLMAYVALKDYSQKVETNFHGNFEFKNIPVGKHTLVVGYTGYETVEIAVHITKDKTSRIRCGLYQKTIVLGDYHPIHTDHTEASLAVETSLE
ncbi:carboxypeptidase-like regulatory domain-containing protein [Maribacter arenosus]|uniref:Carboxypeptidase-like regulatory domain-containing protein n=1 Tax=Maribacter arenosus TaxID=1854708 RepID=A0ABR7VAN9_9FLAO|nr:carboxypeptidase-like regulatory domain-containing protein [Maribacter arenosus]MBD0850398.1 carboxypeptidase-like regulatory domain-containing protein [Maribacter arenosus]